ncbi:DNA polymerase III subunit delta [Candidatus Poribacteria bacterium]|nr:DNA polymerase III subunit delta [Candidatus Poribacteria bacterium]
MARSGTGSNARQRLGEIRNIRDIPQAIRGGSVAPVYLAFGSEQYLLEELTDAIVAALSPDAAARSMNVDMLDGTVTTVEELTSIAETFPMAGNRRVVVVHDPAFLSGAAIPTPVEALQQASDAHDSGNDSRALGLLFVALGLEPVPLDSSEAQLQMAALRADVLTQAPALAAFLDGAAGTFGEMPLPDSTDAVSSASRFSEWLSEGPPPTCTVVLMVRGSVDGRSPLVREIARVGVVADVDSLLSGSGGAASRDTVARFIGKRLNDADRRIASDALAAFRSRTNDDLGRIVDELEKLVAYVGDAEEITLSDVTAAVSDGTSSSVFDLTDALGARDLAKALMCLDDVLKQGEPPLRVHAMLVRQVRMMLQARLLCESGRVLDVAPEMSYGAFSSGVHGKWDAETVRSLPSGAQTNLLKQKPYAAYLAFRQSAKFTTAELLVAYERLIEADEEMKSSGGFGDLSLSRTIERIIRPTGSAG